MRNPAGATAAAAAVALSGLTLAASDRVHWYQWTSWAAGATLLVTALARRRA